MNFAVGMVNFIPMELFDGKKMSSLAIEAFLSSKFNMGEEKAQHKASHASLIMVLSIMLVNTVPLFI